MAKDKMEELCDVLKDMMQDSLKCNETGPSEERITEFYDKLKKIYSDWRFEHSDRLLNKFLSTQTPDAYSGLDLWLSKVIEHGNSLERPEYTLCKKLQKLSDHIEWDVTRLNQTETLKQLEMDIQELQRNSRDKLSNLNAKTQKMANDVNKRIDDFHGQSIAILGIFSAVVLVFMTGINFSSSVLDNMNKASLFRLGFTILLLGIVLSNVIYVLLKFVLYLSRRSSTKEPQNYKTGQLWLNIALVTLFVFLLLAYVFGWDKTVALWRQDGFNLDTIPNNDTSAVSEQSSE